MTVPSILVGQRRVMFARLVANGLLQASFAMGTAVLVKEIFDGFLTNEHSELNGYVFALIAGLLMLAAGISWLRMMERVDAESLGQHYAAEVRMLLYDCLSQFTPRALQKRSRGGISLRFVGDMTSLRRWVSMGLSRLIVAGVSTVSALLMLAFIHWQLALTVTASLTIGVSLTYLFGQHMRAATIESRRRLSNLAANVNEKVTSIAVVQVFGQIDRERERILRQSKYLHDSMIARARIAGKVLGITEFSVAMTSAVTLLVGVFAISTGTASIGAIIASISIVSILLPPLRDLARLQEYWHGANIARERIKDFLASPAIVTQAALAPDFVPGPGELRFDHVSIPGSLDQISGIIKPGSVTAIVGPNGAGKSSLLQLAARLIDPAAGRVFLDGQDIASCSLHSIRRSIGMASPDLPLLRGTIDRNLRYRWRKAPNKEVARIRALCEIDELLSKFPAGEKTRVTEGGMNLSIGQRQRISLARALLGNPTVLLLDEIDANLDAQAHQIIQRILTDYRGTVLMVTHHLEHLMAADAIWYLEAGRLIEVCTPAELLTGNGITARFFGCNKAAAM